jgi:hypothetical protein
VTKRDDNVISSDAGKSLPLPGDPPVSPFLQVWPWRRHWLSLVLNDPRPDDVVAAMKEQQLETLYTIMPSAHEAIREVFIKQLIMMDIFCGLQKTAPLIPTHQGGSAVNHQKT